MRWLQTEYLLKGLFLGLLLDVALRQSATAGLSYDNLFIFVGCIAGGLLVALGIAGLLKARQGYGPGGRLAAYALFLLLESPNLVYIGILGGTLLGAWLLPGDLDNLFAQMAAGGAALGVLFGALRDVRDRRMRLGLSLLMGTALVSAAVYWFGLVEGVTARYEIVDPHVFGVFLLAGLPVFYLLTFAGVEEESEVEVGAMCALLGLGLVLITRSSQQFGTIAFLLPLMLYLWYTVYVMPGLRVFKHVLRGMSHAAVGRYRQALLSFRRALQLDPKNKTARDEFWQVHIKLDADQLARDPELLALVDFKLCVERAGSLLLERPDPAQLAEAHRLLDLVTSQKPALKPQVAYWRAVAHTHERRLDDAAAGLTTLLDPTQNSADDRSRQAVLLPAWQLVLTLHDELRRRVGQPQLALPGRRMEAITAVERRLAEEPADESVWPLKRLLYQDLAESEFESAFVDGRPPEAFDYPYAQQLGGALIDDPARWQRGAEFLRMAARGLPALASSIYVQVGEAFGKAGRRDELLRYFERAKKVGRIVGHKNLADPDRHTLFRAVKLLGDEALARNDVDAALDDFQFYAEYERSGVETLRTIATLFEQKGDALAAARVNDQALCYNAKDADLLARKDRYYYSVMPEVLAANRESVGPGFDFDYCLRKARTLIDNPSADLDTLDWADHLVSLALVLKPEHRPARLLRARVRVRRGETDEAAKVLEEVRTPRPEKFAGADDEEAWYQSCQLLGDLYLNNLNRPDQALACLQDFKKSPKSGARTLYRMGQAYEMLGDRERASRCYQQVTAYEGNPLAPEAHEALDRLERS